MSRQFVTKVAQDFLNGRATHLVKKELERLDAYRNMDTLGLIDADEDTLKGYLLEELGTTEDSIIISAIFEDADWDNITEEFSHIYLESEERERNLRDLDLRRAQGGL